MTNRSFESTALLRTQPKKYLGPLFCLCLIILAGCSAGRRFEKAADLDTPEAYREFLKAYPDNKKYSSRAEERLQELSFEAAARKDTYAAYRNYLEAYPLGRFFLPAQRRAEEIRAKELGIHLYRVFPKDFHDLVNPRYLPYRIQVRDLEPAPEESGHLERKWYEQLLNHDLFVPMDTRKAYDVNPDITLRVRESVVRLCVFPLAMVEGEVWIQGNKVKTYRVAAGEEVEKCLLYEIFRDGPRYDAILRAPEEERRDVLNRFEAVRTKLPLDDSVSLEYEVNQKGSEWDRQIVLYYVRFLEELPLAKELFTYQRGRPPGRRHHRRIYLRLDTESHSLSMREQWSSVGPVLKWDDWNSKQILCDRDYYFKKMTLDLLDFLDTNGD